MKDIIFLLGLAGAGKTTTSRILVANIEKEIADGKLEAKGVIYLDGDEFRDAFGGFFSYEREDRIKLALLKIRLSVALAKQGYIIVSSGINLYNEFYKEARQICTQANLKYFECYVRCSFEELFKRDQKGLYSGAQNGKIKNVVGMDMPIDEPIYADLVIDSNANIEENIQMIISKLKEQK